MSTPLNTYPAITRSACTDTALTSSLTLSAIEPQLCFLGFQMNTPAERYDVLYQKYVTNTRQIIAKTLRNRDLADECQQVMWINVWTHMQLHSDIQLPVPIWLRPPGMKPLMYGLRGFRDQPSKYP